MTVGGAAASTETACSRLLLAGTQLTTADCDPISVTLRPLGHSDGSAHATQPPDRRVIASMDRTRPQHRI